jgi:hypothetical protein
MEASLWLAELTIDPRSAAIPKELFDEARLSADYHRKGWSPPGVTKSPIPGLAFLTKLPAEDKTALIAFLRSLGNSVEPCALARLEREARFGADRHSMDVVPERVIARRLVPLRQRQLARRVVLDRPTD